MLCDRNVWLVEDAVQGTCSAVVQVLAEWKPQEIERHLKVGLYSTMLPDSRTSWRQSASEETEENKEH